MNTKTLCLILMLTSLGLAIDAAEHPHIVIILADDMGYGDPGCFNPASKIPTPNIDRLAAEGMRFLDAHAPGALCHPSRYGLVTGRYPFRAPVDSWREQAVIGKGQATIGTVLQAAGYRTAMVGKWHLGFDEKGYDQPLAGGPVDCGFHTFFGFRASTDIPPYFYIRGNRAVAPPTDEIEASSTPGWAPIQGAFWRAGGIAPGLELKDVLPRFTDEAVAVIRDHSRERRDQPLMLYLAFTAPHTPWLPAPEFLGRSGAALYGDFTVMVDAMVGRVLAALEASGMGDKTLVLFTSDNGPTWYEADVERLGHDSAGGWRGMKADAWEAGHRMPFIVRWPGHVRPGSISRQTICFTDLLATLAAVAGTELPAGAGPDSVSFLPVLLGEQSEDDPIRGPIVVLSGNGTLAIRSGPWKYIAGLGSGGFSKPARIEPEPGGPLGQLYDLSRDPGETTNLYSEEPAIVARLQAELERIRQPGASPGSGS